MCRSIEEMRKQEREEGRQEGIDLIGELLKILEPLGRIGDLIATTADKTKLNALAQEFELQL